MAAVRMLALSATRRVAVSQLHPLTFPASRARGITGIKILEEQGHARENLYWAQEDEKLIKKMIENNPELDPAFKDLSGMLDDGSSTADKVKLIFAKHGIPPVNKALIADIVALIEK
mmetsp:Transcript_54279/g.151027  ORF Transcript_54279/g.151027 Transcript_54279/m.151027 type:complete len:117 (+) Transcript_54279:102-452(+)|eukprot:CAMPEP_0117499688 /NCGR_PEP_ID=MMETSP0784-20121206/22375_1 /TAXON_ID=39447 /ORGANISM="" /LENGTH=116 /DNA_ID=CAMNT_0005294845 /DNA_START=101 /DNA_END=451 /DNA_ORIENTATION=+